MARELSDVVAGLPARAPGWVDADRLRRRLSDALTPDATRELWKYTPIDTFVEPVADTPVSQPTITGAGAGEAQLSHLAAGRAPAGIPGDPATASRFPLADLALLVTGNCVHVQLPPDARADLDITFAAGINMPVVVEVGTGAALRLCETVAPARFCNQSLYVHVAEGGRLEHARTAFDEDCCHWSLTQVVLEENADYGLTQYLRGGQRRRSETHVIMNGRGARAELIGAYVVGRGHLDQQIIVEHRAPGAVSRQVFHGLGAGKGRSVFNGRIHIHPDTPGSDARLSNRNLALHPDAQINTKPELEIYTDDVKCAHGATVGKLSEDNLFYLRSRGVDAESARTLLCRAFLNECISGPLADAASGALLRDLGDPARARTA